jgi:general secretion pathway protein C
MDLLHKISLLRSAAIAKPAGEWVNLANQRLPGAFTLLLIFMIALYTSRLVWALLPLNTEFDWSVRAPISGTMAPLMMNAGDIDYPAIAAAHIFGIPGAEPVYQEETSDAPDTSLNLKLRGTIAADDPGFAHAIIADGKGQDNVYFLKDKVPGGATLQEIHPDRVILNRAGQLEARRLPKLSESLVKQATPTRRASTINRPSSQPSNARTRPASGGFMQVFRPQPYMPNGELKGYRVYPGRDRRKFAALGFRPGDLVTSINGQDLQSLQTSPMEIFGDIDNQSQLSFTVERSGQPVVITLDSDQMQSMTELD